jgi:Iap family predicted aminopeptidase
VSYTLQTSFKLFSQNFLNLVYSLDVGEAPAGSMAERRLVRKLAELIESYLGVRANLTPLPVVEWRDEGSYIRGCEVEFPVLALPQTPRATVEGRVQFFPRAEQLEEADHVAEIVVVEAPRDFDEIQSLYLEAFEKGAKAVVFYDPWPHRYRRFVVTGRWEYTFAPSPAPIPAVYAKRDNAYKLRECSYIVVEHRGTLVESTGYIVEALVDTGGDDELLVTAHHDHWLRGVNDNLAGVALALAIAKHLSRVQPAKLSIRFISFTAEEFGDPTLPAWYWAYGSRAYATSLSAAGRLDNVIAVFNLDIASTQAPKVYATGYEVWGLIEPLAAQLQLSFSGFDHSYSDGYSFSKLGVTTVTLMDLEGLSPVYHSDMDTLAYLSLEGAWKSFSLVVTVAEKILQHGREALNPMHYVNMLYKESLKGRPIPVRVETYRLKRVFEEALKRGCRDVVFKSIRRLNAELIAAVFEGDYRVSKGGFRTAIMPQLLIVNDLRLLVRAADLVKHGRFEDARKTLLELPPARIIVGREEHTYSAITPSVYKLLESGASRLDLTRLVDQAVKAAEHAVSRAAFEVSSLIGEVADHILLRCAGEGVSVEEFKRDTLSERPSYKPA